MSKKFKFSIVLFLDLEAKKSIDSIINQELSFENNIQLILLCNNDTAVDLASSYKTKYPNNIVILSIDSFENFNFESSELIDDDYTSINYKENINYLRNLAIGYCDGDYMGFLESGDKYGLDALKKVCIFFDNYDNVNLVSLSVLNLENKKEKFTNEFLFDEKLIDLSNYKTDENNYFYLPIYSTFIKNSTLSNYKFKADIVDGDGLLIVNEILLNNLKFGFINDAFYYYKDKLSVFEKNISKKSIEDKLNCFFNYLIESSIKSNFLNSNSQKDSLIDSNFELSIPYFIQFVLAKELEKIVKIEDISTIAYNKQDIEKFWKSFFHVLNFIDNEIIENNSILDNNIESFLVYLKNKDFYIDYKEDNVYLKSKNYIIDQLNHPVLLDIIELKDGFLNISGDFLSNFYYESISFEAIKYKYDINSKSEVIDNKELFSGKFYDYFTTERKLLKYLSIPWVYDYNFDLKIPISKNENFKVNIRLNYNENDELIFVYNDIEFRTYSNMSVYSNYIIKDSQMLLFFENSFYLIPYSYKKMFKIDIKALIDIFFSRPGKTLSGIFYRFINLIIYPFMKNMNIWILMDRFDLADDNAEHLFKYIIKQNDDVEAYFTIDKNSPDYKRLLKISKNVIPFGSFKHKIYFLFAKKVIVSQPGVSVYNPFFYENFKIFAGLVTVPIYFLQHGVAKDNMSSWLHKFNRNLSLIVTSSNLETESFWGLGYNYDSEIIQALGLTRFDNLNNDNVKKQILIMPSWRNYIETDEDLLNSEYFKRWNDLINNEEFIELAKSKGYDIIFKPHPNLYKFIGLFDENDYVIIDHEKKYQEIFNASALLITDYSSIFFDFSYIKKPIIYYQYANDYHFDSENGYFQYETMGFGDVIAKEDSLIDKVGYYLNNGCVMEDKFKNRVEGFFKYNDRNNCKRNYDWIYEH